MVRNGDRLFDPNAPRYTRRWRDLDWFCRANQGLDHQEHTVRAWVKDELLYVQHGDNPEAIRSFSLEELNQVGDFWGVNPVLAWCEEVDACQLPLPKGSGL